jgi:PrtD family type I secretion system ABC transporter
MPTPAAARPAVNAPLRRLARACRTHLVAAAAFSGAVNLLNLTPTLYTMQVYDRVLATGHLATLLMLTVICVGTLGALALFDWLRARVLLRAGARVDTLVAGPLLDTLLSRPGLSRLDRAEGMRQLDTLRGGIAGPAVVAAFDLPWALLYIAVAFLLHPLLGALALGGCAVLAALAWRNEKAVHARTSRAEAGAAIAHEVHAHVSAYAAEVRAMGLHDALVARQLRERDAVKSLQLGAGMAAVGYSNLVRFVRIALQIAATGCGALLAVKGVISPGAVIAAGFLFARAMAPIDQAVAGWRGLVATYNAARRISVLLAPRPQGEHIRLPGLEGRVAAERLTVVAPQSDRVALTDVSFAIEASARSSVDLPAARGTIRFDSTAYGDWYPDQITRAIGYLPQEFVLFPGTIRDNISRFDVELGVDEAEIDRRVVEAASALGLHETIARLPDGYATRIGAGGVGLSAGQTQQVALARALYGEPRVLILDEPNAHLDADGEHRLRKLLSAMRARRVTVIMAAHSSEVLASMDKLLHLRGGTVAGFGPLPTGDTGQRAKPAARVTTAMTKDA